ncbi:hypothetical protein [Variovorax boronicumulans]|uniref:hypothetical protein n=1 Tax=Variovorax boronicumulans TaxID=436515 RepID=UPI00085BE92B|nr:hypothetical protein [Variovorax boronicumulans]OEZ27409.1 hypothetical protein AO062_28170 [Variovorax boronicumulans]
MSTQLTPEDRRLRFEAHRFSIETLVKIHLEHIEGSRLLAVSHLRMMFTLSLGALAGLITLYASVLRFGSAVSGAPNDPLRVDFAVTALALVVASALLSAIGLQRASASSSNFLRDPFPDAEIVMTGLAGDTHADEHQILRQLDEMLEVRLSRQPQFKARTLATNTLLICGIMFAGLSFLERMHMVFP